MIKLEHVVLPSPEQMEFVIEGMRNSHNSWDKSDSGVFSDEPIFKDGEINPDALFKVGPNDLKLMKNLSKASADERKFMRMMPVMVRITAPLYWWKEFDTYKVGTVANSCSTMHKIAEKVFTLEDFSMDHLFNGIVGCDCYDSYKDLIIMLNVLRENYLKCPNNNIDKKNAIWWQLIQLLPSSYNQTRNVMLNYEVLHNMYHARKGHKLDEWRDFCNWMIDLPYFELITGTGDVYGDNQI